MAPSASVPPAVICGSGTCSVPRTEMLRYLGHRGQKMDGTLERLLDSVTEEAQRIAQPRWCFALFAATRTAQGLDLQGAALHLPFDHLGRIWQRACGCGLMACTLGARFDQRLQALAYASPTEAVIFDAAGSALAESCAGLCNDALEAAAAGLPGVVSCGRRVSPGYKPIPASLSEDILQVLDGQRHLGLHVTEGGALIPTKSVTALVPLLPEAASAPSMD